MVEDDAAVVEFNTDVVYPHALDTRHHASIGGLLDKNGVARGEHGVVDEIQRLQRS